MEIKFKYELHRGVLFGRSSCTNFSVMSAGSVCSVDRRVDLDVYGLGGYVGKIVSVSGKVFNCRESNPFTKSTRKERQGMFLLKDVEIEGFPIHHLWVFRYSYNSSWKKGDFVRFTGRLRTYTDPKSGVEKFDVKAPIRIATGIISPEIEIPPSKYCKIETISEDDDIIPSSEGETLRIPSPDGTGS